MMNVDNTLSDLGRGSSDSIMRCSSGKRFQANAPWLNMGRLRLVDSIDALDSRGADFKNLRINWLQKLVLTMRCDGVNFEEAWELEGRRGDQRVFIGGVTFVFWSGSSGSIGPLQTLVAFCSFWFSARNSNSLKFEGLIWSHGINSARSRCLSNTTDLLRPESN